MTSTALAPIVEFRQYTLHPGRRDELIELFEREFVREHEAAGITLAGLFRDAQRPDRFVWIRGFSDMESRRAALEALYGGACWRKHRDAANATMLDSDNVLLLSPLSSSATLSEGVFRGPLLAAIYLFASESESAAFARRAAADVSDVIRGDGGTVVAILTVLPVANTFPALPVREGEHAVVMLLDGIEPERLTAHGIAPDELVHLVPAARSKMQLARKGTPGDFDFLNGDWTVKHRKLRSRLTGSTEWVEETGSCRGFALADGVVSVDEFDFPVARRKGCSLRNLDREAQRWTIHWTTNQSGRLFSPVHGGFRDGRGEFYGYDLENGTPVYVRYIWSACDSPAPRWEQAFSVDGGRNWETNWTMEFTRCSP